MKVVGIHLSSYPGGDTHICLKMEVAILICLRRACIWYWLTTLVQGAGEPPLLHGMQDGQDIKGFGIQMSFDLKVTHPSALD